MSDLIEFGDVWSPTRIRTKEKLHVGFDGDLGIPDFNKNENLHTHTYTVHTHTHTHVRNTRHTNTVSGF